MPSAAPLNLPTILCLHGMGTSAAIFEAQTRNLRHALRAHFKFVFINAPHLSMPGPGVEPTYVDSGPFYSWFTDSMGSGDVSMAIQELTHLTHYIKAALEEQSINQEDIVSVMGFSQGTIVASMMLLQAQNQQTIVLPSGRRQSSAGPLDLFGGSSIKLTALRFGILLSGSCNDDIVTAFMGKRLQLPSVHLHGLQDPYLDNARLLHQGIYHAASSDVVEFDGGHNVRTSLS